MRRLCALCRHESREQIEAEIVGGKSLRASAGEYGLHYTQVQRHMSNHYTKGYVAPQPIYRRLSESNLSDEVDDIGRSIDQVDRREPSALEKVRDLHKRVERVLVCGEKLGNSGEILRAASELHTT